MVDRKLRDVLHPELSDNVDKERRKVATALLTGVAFVAPLMASFAKDGLQFSPAMAAGRKKKATKKKATKKKATKRKAKKK
jgi:hypothetical protein